MKRICITLKEGATSYDVAFFYCDDNYKITEEDRKRIACYMNDNDYRFYDQTNTDSHAYEVYKGFFR